MKTRIRTLLPATAVLVSVILGVASVEGATFSANPTLDALVTTGPTGNLVNNNYGGAGSVSVSAAGLEMGELQSVLQFGLGGAVSSFDTLYGAGQWSIASATLRLTTGNANNAIFNSLAGGMFRISWMQNDSWQEGTGTPAAPGATGITFGTLQSTFIGPNDESLGTFAFNDAISGSFSYALGLSPGLLGDIASGGNVSLRLSAADSVVSGVFSSRNFGTAASRPLLTLVAVPEPGTLAIGGLGFAMVTLWRIRVRRKTG